MADDTPPKPILGEMVGRTSKPKPTGPSAFHRADRQKRVQGVGYAYIDPAVALRDPGPIELSDGELQEILDEIYPGPLPTTNTILEALRTLLPPKGIKVPGKPQVQCVRDRKENRHRRRKRGRPRARPELD
jgi:hypothetical protein